MANSTPKGGRKGGTRYPKINLEKAVEYAKRLVSKTHSTAQPADVVKPGVFDSNTWLGDLRLSGTKQYGFLAGDSKGYTATQLAKDVNAATDDELHAQLKTACLKPKIFETLYNTFHNETVSLAKLKQQALNIGVHPDSGEECIEIFVDSVVYAGLGGRTDSDKINIVSSELLQQKPQSNEEEDEEVESQADDTINETTDFSQQIKSTKKTGASNINVNIDIDPSMDPEKLEKLLKLLKGYGAI